MSSHLPSPICEQRLFTGTRLLLVLTVVIFGTNFLKKFGGGHVGTGSFRPTEGTILNVFLLTLPLSFMSLGGALHLPLTHHMSKDNSQSHRHQNPFNPHLSGSF